MVNLLEKTLKLLAKIYTKFNDYILKKESWKLLHILLVLRYRYAPRIRNLFSSVYLLEGKEKHGKKNLKVLYYGNKENLLYITNILFHDAPARKFLGNLTYSKVYHKINKYLDETGVLE